MEPLSIFTESTLDRSVSRWEDRLHDLTPVERIGGLQFKRDECFAPLGYGGINGGKVRQLVYLVSDYLRTAPEPGLILAASVLSPQLGRVAAIGAHFGIPVTVVLGTSPAKARRKHVNVEIAHGLGVRFVQTGVAYNPALQAKAREVLREQPGSYMLEYGLSVEGSDERVEAFYRFAGEQAANLPDVETLILPGGSYNTTVAVLYAIARNPPARLRNVVVFGIAPPRLPWLEDRLERIGAISGVSISRMFRRDYRHHRDVEAAYSRPGDGPINLLHFDLHSTGFAKWGDMLPAEYADGRHTLHLHPGYEGKIAHYLRLHAETFEPFLRDACFWIVGIEPRFDVMKGFLR